MCWKLQAHLRCILREIFKKDQKLYSKWKEPRKKGGILKKSKLVVCCLAEPQEGKSGFRKTLKATGEKKKTEEQRACNKESSGKRTAVRK